MKKIIPIILTLTVFIFSTPITKADDSITIRQQGKAVLSSESVAARALPYAYIADAVYSDKNVGDWKIEKSWISLLGDLKYIEVMAGFNAQVYKNSKTGEIVLAFEGTTSKADWANNVTQVLVGGTARPSQYMLAEMVTREAIKLYGNGITLTGHSLGGGLAQYAATCHPVRAVTFNAAGLRALNSGAAYGDRVININTKFDPVSEIGNQIGTEYVLNDTKGWYTHGIGTIIQSLEATANRPRQGIAVNWASVSFARGNMASVISGNVSATGSAHQGGGMTTRSQAVPSGLFVSNSDVAETEWSLVSGDPNTHLSQGRNFGSISNRGSMKIGRAHV